MFRFGYVILQRKPSFLNIENLIDWLTKPRIGASNQYFGEQNHFLLKTFDQTNGTSDIAVTKTHVYFF